jgi:hypothetical protein
LRHLRHDDRPASGQHRLRTRGGGTDQAASAETRLHATTQIRALFRIGLLAEAAIQAHAKGARLGYGLAQVEVAGVAVCLAKAQPVND